MNKILPITLLASVLANERLDGMFAPYFGVTEPKRPTSIDEVLARAKARRDAPAWDPKL